MDKSISEMLVVWNHPMEHVVLANCTRYTTNTNPLPSVSRPWHHIPISACWIVVHCFLFVLFCLFILFFSFNCISFLVRNLSDQYTKGYKSRNITSIAFVFSFLFIHVLQYNIPLPSCLCRFTQKNLPLLRNN